MSSFGSGNLEATFLFLARRQFVICGICFSLPPTCHLAVSPFQLKSLVSSRADDEELLLPLRRLQIATTSREDAAWHIKGARMLSLATSKNGAHDFRRHRASRCGVPATGRRRRRQAAVPGNPLEEAKPRPDSLCSGQIAQSYLTARKLDSCLKGDQLNRSAGGQWTRARSART